jgi:hypothetical protein|tara:strand:- start:7947 stop:8153 length:207 start_codon:yes stop_codon:yes gene_type:complete
MSDFWELAEKGEMLTGMLRFVSRKVNRTTLNPHGTRTILQQEWLVVEPDQDPANGRHEWRDVPLVEEE